MVPKYEKMKVHKVCIFWSLLIVSSIPYAKICMVIKMTIFSTIHSCPTSRYIQRLNNIETRVLDWKALFCVDKTVEKKIKLINA